MWVNLITFRSNTRKNQKIKKNFIIFICFYRIGVYFPIFVPLFYPIVLEIQKVLKKIIIHYYI